MLDRWKLTLSLIYETISTQKDKFVINSSLLTQRLCKNIPPAFSEQLVLRAIVEDWTHKLSSNGWPSGMLNGPSEAWLFRVDSIWKKQYHKVLSILFQHLITFLSYEWTRSGTRDWIHYKMSKRDNNSS